jgi:hypothetical protein
VDVDTEVAHLDSSMVGRRKKPQEPVVEDIRIQDDAKEEEDH